MEEVFGGVVFFWGSGLVMGHFVWWVGEAFMDEIFGGTLLSGGCCQGILS